MQFGVLGEVLFWDAVWGVVGGVRVRWGVLLLHSSGFVRRAGVQSSACFLLSGVYAGVVFFPFGGSSWSWHNPSD